MSRTILFSLLAALLPLSAQAQAPRSSSAPINISSGKFVADLNGKTGTFVDNVVVTQGDIRLRADSMRVATGPNNQAETITATGNVVVDSPKSGIATGQKGVYTVASRTVTLSGGVVLKRARDVMRGPQLTVNLATGQAQLGGGVTASTPGAPTQGSGRVQAIFNPPPQ